MKFAATVRNGRNTVALVDRSWIRCYGMQTRLINRRIRGNNTESERTLIHREFDGEGRLQVPAARPVGPRLSRVHG